MVLADTTYEDRTGCSEMPAHKIQKMGNHPKVRILHSEHGESFKSGKLMCTVQRLKIQPVRYR